MDNVNNYYQNTGISELWERFVAILPDGFSSFSDPGSISSLGPDALLRELAACAGGGGGEVFSFFVLLCGAVLLGSTVRLLGAEMRSAASGAVSAVLSLLIFGALYPLFLSVSASLSLVGEFFGAAAPVLLSYLVLVGGGVTAASSAAGLNATVWLLGGISKNFLLPMTAAVFATSAVSSSFGGAAAGISGSIKKIFGRAAGIVGAAVSALFALQTYISSASDGAAMRAARYAASSLIPTVGGAVSGALTTLVGGLSAVGRVIGASSVAVLVTMALSPLVMLLLYRLAFYLASLVGELAGAPSSVVTAFSSALDTLITVYVMTTLVYIFEVILLVSGGGAVLGAW